MGTQKELLYCGVWSVLLIPGQSEVFLLVLGAVTAGLYLLNCPHCCVEDEIECRKWYLTRESRWRFPIMPNGMSRGCSCTSRGLSGVGGPPHWPRGVTCAFGGSDHQFHFPFPTGLLSLVEGRATRPFSLPSPREPFSSFFVLPGEIQSAARSPRLKSRLSRKRVAWM